MWVCILVLTLLGVISRIPQLVSPHQLLDGDECILALMAKHTAEGKEFPIFFYGQNYGLSLFEVLAGACSFQVLGFGTVPLKLAMLALWMVGVALYFAALSPISGDRKSFWMTLLLVLMPAWAIFSMKARGGYITAFSITAIILFLLVSDVRMSRRRTWFVTGLLTALVYFSQALWLPGVLPIIVYLLVRNRNISGAISWASGIAIMVVLVWLLAGRNPNAYWTPAPAISVSLSPHSFLELAKKTYINFTGSYSQRRRIEPRTATNLAAIVWCVLLLAGFSFQAYRIYRRRFSYWSGLFCLSVLATLGFALFWKPGYPPRYLLPVSGLLVLWIGADISDVMDWNARWRKSCLVVLLLLIGLGTRSMMEFKNFTFLSVVQSPQMSEEERMEAFLSYLRANGIQHTFSINPLLQWQIMFYSGERIISRWMSDTDRYPKYPREVDEAMAEGRKTALVGYYEDLSRSVASRVEIVRVGERYAVVANPDQRLLRDLGFRFSSDEN
jgi:hypothetical protein